MRLTSRVDLNVGLVCNIKCRFCYDLDHLNQQKGPSLEILRKRMAALKKSGIDTIDLTGGEATVRKDLPEIIRMVREEFGIDKICLITNGFKLADEAYMDTIIGAGVNEFLFSIHGASAEVHDGLADVRGSFDRVMKALGHAARRPVKIRVNTTVTSRNYDKLGDIAAMIGPFKVENYNLILYNPILDAEHRVDELAVKYSVAAPFLKEVIDAYGRCFKFLHVKYIPLCFMQGYESHVMNLLQATYVPYEWDFCQRARLRRGSLLYGMGAVAGVVSCLDLRALGGRNSREIIRDGFISFQEMTGKDRPFKCGRCKYSLICSGVWRGYKQSFGVDELVPVPGPKVVKPYHFYEP